MIAAMQAQRDANAHALPDLRLDRADRILVDHLRQSGRMSNRALAEASGLSEATVASRLRRLEQERAISVVAITDIVAAGYQHLAFAKVRASGASVLSVGASFAKIPEVISISVTTGQYDLVLAVLARDVDHLSELAGGVIPAAKGVDEVRWELALDVLRFESRWAALRSSLPPDGLEVRGLDDLDTGIIRWLQRDARTSNRSIGDELGVSEGTVRTRIRRLETEGVIRIQAVSDVQALGLHASAYVGVRTVGGQVASVARKLADMPEAPIVTRSLGDFDLFVVVATEDRQGLVELVLERIAATKGVRRTETIEIVTTLKHSYTFGRLL